MYNVTKGERNIAITVHSPFSRCMYTINGFSKVGWGELKTLGKSEFRYGTFFCLFFDLLLDHYQNDQYDWAYIISYKNVFISHSAGNLGMSS